MPMGGCLSLGYMPWPWLLHAMALAAFAYTQILTDFPKNEGPFGK